MSKDSTAHHVMWGAVSEGKMQNNLSSFLQLEKSSWHAPGKVCPRAFSQAVRASAWTLVPRQLNGLST